MDVLDRVREMNAEVGVAEAELAAARRRLLEGIEADGPRARKRARPVFLIAGVLVGAAAATAAVVVVNQPAPANPRIEAGPVQTVEPSPTPPQATPEPTPITGTGSVEQFPGTTPQAGQYLLVQNTTESLLYRDANARVYGWAFGSVTDPPPISGILVQDSGETYIPADRSDEWILRVGPHAQRMQFFPEDQGPAGELAWDNLLPSSDQVTERRGLGAEGLGWRSDEWYQALPTESEALLDYLYALHPADSLEQTEEESVELMVNELRSNHAPATVRAALLGALHRADIVEIVPSQDGVTEFRIRYEVRGGRTDTLSVSDATGWVTEYTMRVDRAGDEQDPVPSDIPDVRMTYTVSIVDAVL